MHHNETGLMEKGHQHYSLRVIAFMIYRLFSASSAHLSLLCRYQAARVDELRGGLSNCPDLAVYCGPFLLLFMSPVRLVVNPAPDF